MTYRARTLRAMDATLRPPPVEISEIAPLRPQLRVAMVTEFEAALATVLAEAGQRRAVAA